MKHYRIFTFLIITAFCVLAGCSSVNKSHGEQYQGAISQLHFINEYTVPHNRQFKGTTIGGLSGIDYDAKRELYYMICDDRSDINPARFYKAMVFVGEKGIDSVQFIDVVNLLQQNGNVYPGSKQDAAHSPDPEALRYNPEKDEIAWSSEGERIVQQGKIVLENPAVIAATLDGNYKDTFVLPKQLHMHVTENGPRRNGAFEGLTFSNDFRYLYVSMEEPIYDDGARAGLNDSTGWVRIVKYDVASRQPIAQYAYQIEGVVYPENPRGSFKLNGVSDILWVGNDQFIIIERSFSVGRPASTIRVFLADASRATDVSGNVSFKSQPPAHPLNKKLLINMDSLGRYIDNIEGVTFGPVLPNGHRTLIFVADNNFSKEQVNQFLLFEVVERR